MFRPEKTKNRRIALIQPLRIQEMCKRSLPLGLLSLASYIKQCDYEPSIVDLYVLSRGNNNSLNYFNDAAKEIIFNYKPDVIGFSVMCSNLPAALLMAKECKNLAPRLPIIFGGPEVCFEEIEILENFEQVDIIVRGEGEETLLELLNALKANKTLSEVLGITYRQADRIIRNPDRPFIKDLDQIPFLDFSLLPNLAMYDAKIEAGRGCPFSCSFCSTCRMWKRNFRVKSPRRIVQELKEVKKFFGNSCIEIIHDHFLASRKFRNDFFSLLINEGITWGCNSRPDVLDENMIKKMKKAGCRQMLIGIETGSAEMQKRIKKNLSLKKVAQVIKMLSANDIKVSISFIIDFPGETEIQVNQTLSMALNLKIIDPSLDIQMLLFTFLKGTDLYLEEKKKSNKYVYRETIASPLTTGLLEEISLINKYPRLFPSFYYIGEKIGQSSVLCKFAFLFSFLIKSYARPTLSLLKHLCVSPYEIGQKLVCFFDEEEVDWNPSRGFHFPQYVAPLRKFIRKYANLLYDDFFWWDKKFERWNKSKKVQYDHV